MIFIIVTKIYYKQQYNIILMMFDTYTTLDLSLIFNETGYINKDQQCYMPDCGLAKGCQNIGLVNIVFTQSKNSPIKIGDNFLCDCPRLISIDTSQLVNVVEIGNRVFYNCYSLKTFKASGLSHLTVIGFDFLWDETSSFPPFYKLNHRISRCNRRTTIVKHPSDNLLKKLACKNHKIVQLYNKPCIHLVNDCVI